MQWIDEMFVNMEKERSAKRVERAVSSIRAMSTSLTTTESAGQTPARLAQRHFQCEVHLPGMHAKSLALSLDEKDLRISVHPDFPEQPLTITVEIGKEGQRSHWMLGGATEENAMPTDQQLSEYLLKPMLSTAAISREI